MWQARRDAASLGEQLASVRTQLADALGEQVGEG